MSIPTMVDHLKAQAKSLSEQTMFAPHGTGAWHRLHRELSNVERRISLFTPKKVSLPRPERGKKTNG